MLYLRSRVAGYTLASFAVVAFLEWLGGRLLLMPLWAVPAMSLIPVLLFAPLAAACIVGVGTRSPFGEIERTLSYPLPALRLFHLAGLLACGSLMLSIATIGWDLPYTGLIVTRNVLGLSGLAFITARIVGSGLSWTLPLAYVALVQLAGRDSEGEWSQWAWPAHPFTDYLSGLLAATLLVVGLLTACFFGPREVLASME